MRSWSRRIIGGEGDRPDLDIDIVFSGVRPREKLFEELETAGEYIAKTRHPKIFIGKLAPYPAEKLEHGLKRLEELACDGGDKEIRILLSELLPEADLGGFRKPKRRKRKRYDRFRRSRSTRHSCSANGPAKSQLSLLHLNGLVYLKLLVKID